MLSLSITGGPASEGDFDHRPPYVNAPISQQNCRSATECPTVEWVGFDVLNFFSMGHRPAVFMLRSGIKRIKTNLEMLCNARQPFHEQI